MRSEVERVKAFAPLIYTVGLGSEGSRDVETLREGSTAFQKHLPKSHVYVLSMMSLFYSRDMLTHRPCLTNRLLRRHQPASSSESIQHPPSSVHGTASSSKLRSGRAPIDQPRAAMQSGHIPHPAADRAGIPGQ